jgi:prevent-host-death family protein
MQSKKKKTPKKQAVSQTWQLQTAKARFSEVFRRAREDGPQLVTRQGKDAVVILPLEDFHQLVDRAREPKSLVRFFAESPLVGLDLNLERDADTGRDVKL